MATRSAIGYINIDGTVTGTYCHWDGYPEHNGAVLKESYTNTDKIRQLIAGGEISSLDDEIGEKHPFSQFEENMTSEEFIQAKRNYTTYYHRDRGEEWERVKPNTFAGVPEFIDHYDPCGCEYYYIWNGKEWLVNKYNERDLMEFPIMERVEDVLEQRKDLA